MARLIRNTAILAKVESAYGVDSLPVGTTDALLISNVSINMLVAQNVDRDIIRPYLGASEQLIGTNYVEMSFDVELQSSGSMTAPTIPAWGPLVRACGLAQVATATFQVEYTPVSTGFESVTLYYFLDGVLRKALGCRGTMTIAAGIGERPVMSFAFKGIDGGATAQALPALTLSAFKIPAVVTDPNTGDVLLGCSYTAGPAALTAGTAYPSRGIRFDLGNQVEYIPLLGGQSVEIVNRSMTTSLQLDLSAAQEVTFDAAVKSNTLQSIGIQHGTTAGSKILMFAPAVQLINPTYQDVSGRAMVGFDGRVTPVSGNDEFRLVAA